MLSVSEALPSDNPESVSLGAWQLTRGHRAPNIFFKCGDQKIEMFNLAAFLLGTKGSERKRECLRQASGSGLARTGQI